MGIILVAGGWKKTNGFCHKAPRLSGCINMWEQEGMIYRQIYDPCSNLLQCGRQVNLRCDYGVTEEYKTCRENYEGRKIDTESLSLIAIVEASGGLCPGGVVCGSKISVRNDGSVTTTEGKLVMLPAEVLQLQEVMTIENLNKLKAQKFTGTCPSAYDGQEVVFKFYPGRGEEKIGSCEYAIPEDNPLMKQMELVMQKAGW